MSAHKSLEGLKTAELDIPVQGKVFTITYCHLRHEDLKFYADNPRVYSALHERETKAPTQDEIEAHLQKTDHVRELREDIRKNGGLIDPLIVKDATKEVVEGNCRLAAYRLLAQENPIKWERARSFVLPNEVNDSDIASILGQLHLKGKLNWRPYEQAAFLHRRFTIDKVSIPDLAKEIPLKEPTIKHRIAVIEYMIKQGDNTIEHWSHYDVFLSNRKIQKAVQEHPGFEEKLREIIKDGAVKALDFRDKLKVVCSTKSADPIKLIVDGKPLNTAFQAAKSLGGDHSSLLRIRKFRELLLAQETKRDIQAANSKVKADLAFELTKIKKQIPVLLKLAKPESK
jgi:hypothetical protein